MASGAQHGSCAGDTSTVSGTLRVLGGPGSICRARPTAILHFDGASSVRLRVAMSETFTPLQTKESCHVELHCAVQSADPYTDRPQLRTPPASEPSSLTLPQPVPNHAHSLSFFPYTVSGRYGCAVSTASSQYHVSDLVHSQRTYIWIPLPDSPAACVTAGFFLSHIYPQLSFSLSLVCYFHISSSAIYSSFIATKAQTVLHQSCSDTLLYYAFQLLVFSTYLPIPSP